MDSASAIFDLSQREIGEIIGAKLTHFDGNFLKDDVSGLEAGTLGNMEIEGGGKLKIRGQSFRSSTAGGGNFVKNFAPMIGDDVVDLISNGAHATSSSTTTSIEAHVYYRTAAFRESPVFYASPLSSNPGENQTLNGKFGG